MRLKTGWDWPRKLLSLLAAVATAAVLMVTAAATASAGPPPPDDNTHVGGPISRSEVIARAQGWFAYNGTNTTMLPYNQGRCFVTGDRTATGGLRTTPTGSAGCAPPSYRTDCSGFVSMALKLDHSYYVGAAGESITSSSLVNPVPSKDALASGDLLVHLDSNPDNRHVRMFDMWTDASHTTYWFYDFGKSPIRHETQQWNSYFTPYRYKNITGDDSQTWHYLPTGATKPAGVSASFVTYYPGATAGSPLTFTTWGDTINVRSTPSTSSQVRTTVSGGADVRISCQQHAQSITAEGVTNDAWSYLPDYGGWMTNIYLQGPDWMPGVPACDGSSGGAGTFTTWGDGVNVRSGPSTAGSVVTTIGGGLSVKVSCQAHGGWVTAEGTSNDAWSYLPDYGGWITNIYLQGPAWLPGVPECLSA